jgi:C4-dicarboxylate transporter DctM subunit
MTATLAGFGALFLLLFFGLPLTLALGLVGYVGFGLIVGFAPSGAIVAQTAWDTVSNYNLTVLPLFLLMGNLVNRAGLSRELYDASNAFVGHRRGGLAMATVIACGGFSAVCGSSVATAVTMGKIALPSMRRYGYSDALSTGSVAAGGTLGILIPPSVLMVIYGTMTETSVGKLFIAGIVPGIIGVLLYMAAVRVHILLDEEAGPAGPLTAWRDRFVKLAAVWPTLALFVLVIGGIYFGMFTAAEAAGIGAAGALVIALLRRSLTLRSFIAVLGDTVRTTASLMAVLIGALIFANFVNVSGVSSQTVGMIRELSVTPFVVILIMIGFYLVLGCVFESLAMMLLTLPVFFPLVVELGYDPVWFGVLMVVLVEISLITPPIGMNLFVIRSVVQTVPTTTIFRGILPFVAADIVRLAIILLLPALILFLPNKMN